MKIKILVLVSLLMFIQCVGFCKNLENSKQIKEEQKIDITLKETINNDKAIAYKTLIKEDYWETMYYKGEDNHTIFSEIYQNIKKYKNNPESDNYIYTQKSIDLYNGLLEKSSIRKHTTNEVILERIDIPDEKFDKIDKNVLGNIILLNVILHNIQGESLK